MKKKGCKKEDAKEMVRKICKRGVHFLFLEFAYHRAKIYDTENVMNIGSCSVNGIENRLKHGHLLHGRLGSVMMDT